jgi:hypothetical protein
MTWGSRISYSGPCRRTALLTVTAQIPAPPPLPSQPHRGGLSAHFPPLLTIHATQLSSQHGLQGTTAVAECGLQLSSAAIGQVLLHLTGAAGVPLGADPQVLTCGEGWHEGGGGAQENWLHRPPGLDSGAGMCHSRMGLNSGLGPWVKSGMRDECGSAWLLSQTPRGVMQCVPVAHERVPSKELVWGLCEVGVGRYQAHR